MRSLDKPGEPLSDDDPKSRRGAAAVAARYGEATAAAPSQLHDPVPKKLKGVAHE